MFTLLVVLHVIFCVFLILVILLQTGKGAGMGTAFGGASQTVFGPRGAGSFIGKLTGIVAALFMLTSLVLAYMSSSVSSGVADKVSALNEEQPKNVENVSLTETATDATEIGTEQTEGEEQADAGKAAPENAEPAAKAAEPKAAPKEDKPAAAPKAAPKADKPAEPEAAPKENKAVEPKTKPEEAKPKQTDTPKTPETAPAE